MAPKKDTKKKEDKAAPAPEPEKAAEKPAAEAAPKKRKAEAAPKAEPAKKEAKVDEEPKKEEEKKEAPAEPVNAEKEQDEPKDKRPAIKDPVCFNPEDTTLNAIPSLGDKILTTLSEGGVQYLISGARANHGIKAGRYAFEIKVLEGRTWHQQRGPRQVLRVGFSTAGSSLILGDKDSEGQIAFDAEGSLLTGKQKKGGPFKFGLNQTVAVLLNLDPKSPNANTISLFRDGVRAGQPQPIPEELKGKALFPHVSTRYATVQVNFGPLPLKPLPFTCRLIASAAQADVEVAPAAPKTKDGKYEVLFPVLLPDEGGFDWLDSHLAKNPHLVELSDRKLVQWAESSGMWRGTHGSKFNVSNDKPDFSFGLPGMDDNSTHNVSHNIASIVPRNYVVMEIKSNLLEAERKALLKKFSAPHFKKVAHVVMGEPSKEYRQRVLDKILKEKQDKANMTWKAKKLELERKKQLAELAKKAEEAKKAAAEKRAAEAKAKAEAAAEAKAKADAEKGEATKMEVDEEGKGKEEAKKEEAKEEPKEEAKEEAKEEVKEEEKKDEPMEEALPDEPPKVELTEEEKKLCFIPPKPGGASDLSSVVMKQFFAKFSIPEAGEGFDEVRYEWSKAPKAKEHLRAWVLERKRNSRMEELVPGQWFQEKLKEWQKILTEWQAKQKTYQESAGAKEDKKKKAEKADGEEEAAELGDISSVADVTDVGNGEPLFKDFSLEDWALTQLRAELYLLLRAFKKDVNDPDRVLHEPHFAFYYNKYYRKMLSPQHFGVTSQADLITMVKETVSFDEGKVLVTGLSEDLDDLDTFVKQTEENRRVRQRRLDAGDETARLKFAPQALAKPGAVPPVVPGPVAAAAAAATPGEQPAAAAGGGKQGGGKRGKGGGKGKKW